MSSVNNSIRSPPPHRQSVKQRPGGPLGSSLNHPAGTPSPAWRQALKQSCLDRARKNRREAVLRSRGLSPTGTGASKANNAGTLSFTPLKAAIASMASPPPRGDAKALVEEELRAKGVSVFSTPQPGGLGSVPKYGMAKTLFAGTERSSNQMVEDMVDHAISMDEVYALMRDVEEELQREEARLLEELHAMEQQQIMEQRRMEEQIADFEQHTSMQMQQQIAAAIGSSVPSMAGVGAGAAGASATPAANDSLPCPVCTAANLIYTPANVIICPNTDNGRCNLRLDVAREGLTMSNFRDLLCRACIEHSSTGCPGTLRFQMMAQFGMTNLLAGCEQCKASTMIV
jgi:hypothetical protein